MDELEIHNFQLIFHFISHVLLFIQISHTFFIDIENIWSNSAQNIFGLILFRNTDFYDNLFILEVLFCLFRHYVTIY